MKRSHLFGLAVLVAIIVISAGFLGIHSQDNSLSKPISKPNTVAVSRGDIYLTVTAPGKLAWAHTENLVMNASGPVEKILVRPGDVVRGGDVLLRLGNRAELEADLASAQISVLEARQALNAIFEEAPLHQALAQRRIAEAQVNSEDAYQQLDLLDSSASDFARAVGEANLAVAQAEFALATAAYETLENGVHPLERALAEDQLAQAEAQRKLAEERLAAVELLAPFDGVVTEINVNVGSIVISGMKAIKLVKPHALEVVTQIIEEDLPLVQIGQQAQVFFDAAPENIVNGRVSRIVPERVSDDRPLYLVYLELVEIPDSLVSGMTADASIIIDQRMDVSQLPRAMVHARPDGTADLKIWRDDREVPVQVEVGLRGDVYIEIIQGLEPGDQVVTQ